MGMHSTTARNGDTVKYFICSTYRKSRRKQCHANSFRTSKADNAIAQLLDTVKDRIDKLTDNRLLETLRKEEWARQSELGKVMHEIVTGEFGEEITITGLSYEEAAQDPTRVGLWLWNQALEAYSQRHDSEGQQGRERLAAIDAELNTIAQALKRGIPSQTVLDALNQDMLALEYEKSKLQTALVPLTAKADTLQAQLHAIKRTIVQNQERDIARLLESCLERVEVVFEGEYKNGCERPLSFRFVPRTGNPVLSEAMEFDSTRMGTDSWRRPG